MAMRYPAGQILIATAIPCILAAFLMPVMRRQSERAPEAATARA
jgi:hypothetical protein